MTDTGEGWGTPPAPADSSAWHSPAEAVVEQTRTYDVKYASQPPTEEPEAFRMRRNALVQRWLDLKPTAAQAIDAEKAARAEVTGCLFPSPKKGTQRYDIGGGFKVKLVHGLTYTLGDKDKTDDDGEKISIVDQVEAMEAALIDKHGETAAILLKGLVSWKPELSGSAYEKLTGEGLSEAERDVRDAIAAILTVKPASPQLTFEEPKAD